MERRLAVIVLADIVGYGHLMGDDEAATLTAVATLRSSIIDPAVEARGGRLVKAMGDGFLLEFASAVDAVECAVEIQGRVAEMSGETKAAQSIELRIGINVGDIMVEDGDVFGDGVNVAARLEGSADPGGILLSQAAYDQVRDRVQHSFDDLGDRSLKNIARPVKVFRLVMGRPSKPRRPRLQGDFGDLQAVAVLPFDNLSKDPAEDYFVEGLTEDIITALAYWRWFPVVARNSTFVYKGKPKNVTEIGRELGAAYLVEGSARRSGEQIRITVQLIDGATGHHLFAERYDRKIADVFIVQEEIAERIVASIEPEIHRAEARRASRKHPSDLSAWDHALKALSLQERMTPAGHAEARNHLKLALEIDPSSARAWSLLSLCRYHEGILGWVNRADALKSSLEAAEQAVSCDDREWLAQGLRGMGRLWTERDFQSALDGVEQAVALNPSAPLARHFLACVLEFTGHPGEALPHLDAILRLDPHYRFRSLAIADQSLCHLLLDNLGEAISTAEKAIRIQPGNVRARQRLVAALSLRGLSDTARAAAAELSRLQPTLDVAYIDDTYPFMLSHERERFIEALRSASLLHE
ncbi:MAG TPA: adenylate/guanylate cyclase domain-containing protein [Stellaceae bacterium]|nr:adenylate/guanylate cyclase domain-containing protein [Stellaceae bacterium]